MSKNSVQCEDLLITLLYSQFGYQEGTSQYFAMFRKEKDICICTMETDWTTLSSGPVSFWRSGLGTFCLHTYFWHAKVYNFMRIK